MLMLERVGFLRISPRHLKLLLLLSDKVCAGSGVVVTWIWSSLMKTGNGRWSVTVRHKLHPLPSPRLRMSSSAADFYCSSSREEIESILESVIIITRSPKWIVISAQLSSKLFNKYYKDRLFISWWAKPCPSLISSQNANEWRQH